METLALILIAALSFFAGTIYGIGKGLNAYEKEDVETQDFYESQIELLLETNKHLERKLNECYKSA